MPRFALTFAYTGTLGETVAGTHILSRDTLQEAVEHVMRERSLTSIHIRTCNGEVVEREFTFGPSDAKAVA